MERQVTIGELKGLARQIRVAARKEKNANKKRSMLAAARKLLEVVASAEKWFN